MDVNGVAARAPGVRVDPARDLVRVDGRPVERAGDLREAILNKPRGMLVTLRDPGGRWSIGSLLAGFPERVFPVGRLDKESEGLLLLTNDGDLAHRVAHPRFEIPKTYRVTVAGTFGEGDARRLRDGVFLGEGMARPLSVATLTAGDRESVVEVVLGEGRRREVRRMMARLGFRVCALVRTALGPLRLESLGPGEWRWLSPEESASLREAVGLGSGEESEGGPGP